MSWTASAVLSIALASQAVLVSLCTFWPIRHDLPPFLSLQGWRELYSVPESNLDVWLLSSVTCLGSIIYLMITKRTADRQQPSLPPNAHTTVPTVFVIAVEVCQMLR